MLISNWYDASIEMPSGSGEYIILKEKNNDRASYELAIFLKEGDEYVLKPGINKDANMEDRLLYMLSGKDEKVIIKETGFYRIIGDRQTQKEILEPIKSNGLVWLSLSPELLSNNGENPYKDAIKRINSQISEEREWDESLNEMLDIFLDKDKKNIALYKLIKNTFRKGTYKSGGVVYKVDEFLAKEAFVKALRLYSLIRTIGEFEKSEDLVTLCFYKNEDNNITLDDILSLRNELVEYFLRCGAYTSEAESISDIYFSSLCLPRARDLKKAIVGTHYNLNDKKETYARAYQSFLITENLQKYAFICGTTGIPSSSLSEITLLNEAIVDLALSNAEIIEFLPQFETEMGIETTVPSPKVTVQETVPLLRKIHLVD